MTTYRHSFRSDDDTVEAMDLNTCTLRKKQKKAQGPRFRLFGLQAFTIINVKYPIDVNKRIRVYLIGKIVGRIVLSDRSL